MRLFFVGPAFWCTSAYAKMVRNMLPRLSRLGHDMALGCFYGHRGATNETQVDGEPVRLYPPARHGYFNDIIEKHAADFKADVVVSICDVWVLKDWGRRDFLWAPWMPLDTEPIPTQVLEAIGGCFRPLCYSQWGVEQLRTAGWPTARYVPIGVDRKVYKPRDQAEMRLKTGLVEDGLLIGMVSANSSYPSRKSFGEMLSAWAQWVDGGGQGILYMHTTMTPKGQIGVDIERMMETLRLDWSTLDDPDHKRRQRARVIFPAQYRMWTGKYTDENLAEIYSAMDVLFMPSQSEGFGLPALEAQACGIPVVSTNFSAMPEITFVGKCLPATQRIWSEMGVWRGVVGVNDLVGAIEWAEGIHEHLDPILAEQARDATESFAWDRITEDYWVPFLEELA